MLDVVYTLLSKNIKNRLEWLLALAYMLYLYESYISDQELGLRGWKTTRR